MTDKLKTVFTKIKDENHWGDSDSISGGGSNLIQTEIIRKEIPLLLKKYGIGFMIDAPCGDFFWMKLIGDELDNILIKYEGHDIVQEIIDLNIENYANEVKSFHLSDLTLNKLPKADLILTRDCLVHLSFKNIKKVLKNYKKAGIKYLLTTTFTNRKNNIDITDGEWRPLNLQKAPFNFPEPLFLINENCTENDGIYKDKSLGLWELNKINNISNFNIFLKKYFD
ncbi:hypothetical protein A5893_14425 [Pedobacter psychrophilus]|uniref:Methyltransferase domain-containing protein n=1 Tax=Pedobacter psychrophilus TaxID=1826909 RepID=A0A179DC24_9SPHI|nr:hypothetical protein [Pedobacter psychrophilus]OAQ38605.1 hypothetical protein A5893_14425 [Pedobacter psychrophilus]